jgi:multicomponent K+:H+ antiporter subunit F
MIATASSIALAMMTVALALNIWRLLRGPSRVDRIVALDTAYINTVAMLVLLGIIRGSSLYFEAAVLIALLGFAGTVGLARFVLRGDIVE